MKNWRTVAVLAVVFLGLGGLATWDEWQTKKDEADEKAKNKVTEIKAADVVELDYASRPAKGEPVPESAADDEPRTEGEVKVSAVKKDGVWRLAKPVDALADGTTIDGLLSTVVDYVGNKEITDQRDKWAEFGLVEPTRTITLRTAGDQPQTFSIFVGDKVPVGYNVYFRTSKDDKVYMGSQHLLVSTGKTLFDFRDKRFVTIDESKLKGLSYKRRGRAEIEIVKADGKYAIVKPESLDADPEAIREFIEDLKGLRVASFVDTPEAPLVQAFQDPETEIKWTAETGDSSKLLVAERDGKLFAAFDPTQRVLALPDDAKAKLQKDESDFRNRRILSAEILDVQKIDIDGTAYKVVEGSWYLEADASAAGAQNKFALDGKAKEQAHIRAFMVDLEFAKTDRFIPLADPIAKGLTEAPQHRITLAYADAAKAPLVIELFKAADAADKFMVRRSGAPYIYRVPKAAFSSMTPSAAPAADGPDEGDGFDGEDAGAIPELEAPHDSSGLLAPEPEAAPG